MNLPNRLTVMRMALIPFFLIFMLCDGIPHRYLIAAAILGRRRLPTIWTAILPGGTGWSPTSAS